MIKRQLNGERGFFMLTTLSMIELQQIVNASHGDPHTVLGMHEMELEGKPCIVVRVLNPQAKSVTVIDDKYRTRRYPMEKIHTDGLFECVIPTRKKWFKYLLEFEGYGDNTWETYDPYSFPPGISDMDIYLFNQGTHYNIYEKLIAHYASATLVSPALLYLKRRATARMREQVSDTVIVIHTPFSPKMADSMRRATTTNTAPRAMEMVIACFGSSTAVKYPLITTTAPSGRNAGAYILNAATP